MKLDSGVPKPTLVTFMDDPMVCFPLTALSNVLNDLPWCQVGGYVYV